MCFANRKTLSLFPVLPISLRTHQNRAAERPAEQSSGARDESLTVISGPPRVHAAGTVRNYLLFCSGVSGAARVQRRPCPLFQAERHLQCIELRRGLCVHVSDADKVRLTSCRVVISVLSLPTHAGLLARSPPHSCRRVLFACSCLLDLVPNANVIATARWIIDAKTNGTRSCGALFSLPQRGDLARSPPVAPATALSLMRVM